MLQRSPALALALVIAAVTACGDNHSSPDAQPHGDGPVAIDSAIDAAPQTPRAMISTGDFGAGNPGVLARLDVASLVMTTGLAPTGAIGDDIVLRHFGHELFVVNRADGNNVTVLDDTALTVTEQLATGAGTNPQDVAEVGSDLYVPIYGGSASPCSRAARRRRP